MVQTPDGPRVRRGAGLRPPQRTGSIPRRTGGTHTIVPPALAREIGATPLPARFDVSLADGSRRSLKACAMGVEVCDRTGPMTALLLPRGVPLLGVETLEALGLRVNPSTRTLEPTRAQAALL